MNDALDELAQEFFWMFARFEYALKATGHQRRRNNAAPDWKRFARTEAVSTRLENPADTRLSEAIDYILTRPPREQVNENGTLVWRDVPLNTTCRSELLLRLVCRVRNNLFHGGKFDQRGFDDRERTELLLRNSLAILRGCLEASPDLARAYRSGA